MKKFFFRFMMLALLAGCSAVQYQPIPAIAAVDTQHGYRLLNALEKRSLEGDDTFMIVLFSGGGTRAAALGYGVLQSLDSDKMLDDVDLVYGVSGGSVLAAYYSLYGKAGLQNFEKRFLHQDFQGTLKNKVLEASNWPRLLSPEFGRGDLLQEQLDAALFHGKTFADLSTARQGPFAVIAATDMGAGQRLNFVQEFFDPMCVDLGKMPIARAVAASSAVPLVFAPVTVNNHAGSCGYQMPAFLQTQTDPAAGKVLRQKLGTLTDSRRPYLHLVDGGLTDNLGIGSLLDVTDMIPVQVLREKAQSGKIRRIAVISVNAGNRPSKDYDQSPNVPGLAAVASAIIDIPIDRNSEVSLQRFRTFTDRWNKEAGSRPVELYFISLNLTDLPDSALKDKVLNIATSFALSKADIASLQSASRLLLQGNPQYQRLKADIALGKQGHF